MVIFQARTLQMFEKKREKSVGQGSAMIRALVSSLFARHNSTGHRYLANAILWDDKLCVFL